MNTDSQNEEDNEKQEIAENQDNVSFEDLGLDEYTLRAVEKKGFVAPSPIQVLAIPRLLNGDNNIIARARTGTGKTAAFGLPIIQNIREKRDGVQALILEPTRELAMQTCSEMQSFSDGGFPRTCVLYGGASYTTQIRELRNGAEIVVGTPGRIKDHLDRKTLDISKIKYFILDEGDEMLDMGFIDDIEEIFSKANPDSRILLFSATMPAPILKIASKFMGEYETVEEEGVIDEPLLIEQKYWFVREGEKTEALVRLIDISPDFYGLVFTQTKNDADNVCRQLDLRGYEAAALHGDIMQNQREKVLERFRLKKTRILVATDVAARGIDISGLSHVVNYSLPFDAATYVHRIGRTGRAGSSGTAVTFVRPEERRKLGFLQSAVARASKGKMEEGKIPSVDEVLAAKKKRLFDELRRQIFDIQDEILEEQENTAGGSGSPEDESIRTAEIPATAGSISADNSAPAEHEPAAENQTAEFSEQAAVGDETENTAEHGDMVRDTDPMFMELAKSLAAGNDPVRVLSGVLSVLYGDKLSRRHYGKINSLRSSGPKGDQLRIYVQMGKRDGLRPKDIAEFFSDMLNIPDRLVDQIDMAPQFTLLSLPAASAKKAVEMSKENKNLPHIHLDNRDGGQRGGDRGGRERGRRDRFRERTENQRHEGRSKGKRPNFHTQSERSGSAGIYRKKSGKKPERF